MKDADETRRGLSDRGFSSPYLSSLANLSRITARRFTSLRVIQMIDRISQPLSDSMYQIDLLLRHDDVSQSLRETRAGEGYKKLK